MTGAKALPETSPAEVRGQGIIKTALSCQNRSLILPETSPADAPRITASFQHIQNISSFGLTMK